MPNSAALREVEALFYEGHLGHEFVMRDELFRKVLAYWLAEPTLDSLVYGLDALRALSPLAPVPQELEQYYFTAGGDPCRNFVLKHLDTASGGVKHSTQAGWPSLFGCRMFLDALEYLNVPPNVEEETRRGYTYTYKNLESDIGVEAAKAFLEYVYSCEHSTGGFVETLGAAKGIGAQPGVITTGQGYRILRQLGGEDFLRNLKYPSQHIDFLANCWGLSVWGPRFVRSGRTQGYSCINNPQQDKAGWIIPVRYCLSAASYLPTADSRKTILNKVLDHVADFNQFLQGCKRPKGFAHTPDRRESANVIATVNALRLRRFLGDAVGGDSSLSEPLQKTIGLLQVDTAECIEFLESEMIGGGFGWTRRSTVPNLYAFRAGTLIWRELWDRVVSSQDNGRFTEQLGGLGENLIHQLVQFLDSDGMFRAYPRPETQ